MEIVYDEYLESQNNTILREVNPEVSMSKKRGRPKESLEDVVKKYKVKRTYLNTYSVNELLIKIIQAHAS